MNEQSSEKRWLANGRLEMSTSIHKNDMLCKNDGILSTLLDAAKDLVWLPRLLWEESNDHP